MYKVKKIVPFVDRNMMPIQIYNVQNPEEGLVVYKREPQKPRQLSQLLIISGSWGLLLSNINLGFQGKIHNALISDGQVQFCL